MEHQRVIFLRHGNADWPEWDAPDKERPLTKKGQRESKRVARFLCQLNAIPDVIVTSPFARAAETAEITAKVMEVDLLTDDSLAKGFSAGDFRALVRQHQVPLLMIVGHEPDFTRVLRRLTGGGMALAKGGVALIEWSGSASRWMLRWLFTPRFAKRGGRRRISL